MAPAALVGLSWAAPAAATKDTYASNTALYADPKLVEGVDYSRRYRRHAAFDNNRSTSSPFPRTAILAPHGGGIETGTSELCLAVAGYHPATMAATTKGSVYDYWMFEGLRTSNNRELHVTSIHCDDPVAELLCAGMSRALALHGCTSAQAGLPDGAEAALVGGLDTNLKNRLMAAYTSVGIRAIDAKVNPDLDGNNPRNLVNRTFTRQGAQVELTTPLRAAMFNTDTAEQRKNTTTKTFRKFIEATRQALA
jgi:phage replication-related protein YjqB (UPF0714/DUF867 family)